MSKITLKHKNDFGSIEIKNKTDISADLYIYGYIADEKWCDSDIIPSDVKDLLDEVKNTKELNIFINSGGGSVYAGMAIFNMLSRFNAKKCVYVDGLAGSIASVIAFCGDELVVPSNSYLMIHKAWTFAIGNSEDLLKAAEALEVIDKGILNVYKANLKENIDADKIKNLVDAETWLTGEEASEYFDIKVTDPLEAVAYSGKLDYANTPKVFKEPKADKKAEKKKKEKAIALFKLECEI